MNTDFYTRASTQAWFAEELRQFPALPSFSMTGDQLTLIGTGKFEFPQVYEMMVGYRLHLQLAYQDVMANETIYEAFVVAAQKAGKLVIVQG